MSLCKYCGTETVDDRFYCSKKCGYEYRKIVNKNKVVIPKKKPKPNSEIQRVSELAREADMTYGQYVARYL